jgi:signal transduction histidine kinase
MAFRGEAERSRAGGGGLGLAIARGIVEAHDGEIRVENCDGGCLFTVTLPLPVGQA